MIAIGGEQFCFAFSQNGRNWQQLSDTVHGSRIEAICVALTARGAVTGARFASIAQREAWGTGSYFAT